VGIQLCLRMSLINIEYEGSLEVKYMSDEQKIYVVETISTFRHTYYVKARCAEHAMDEVVCKSDYSDNFIEGSQKHIDESIANVIEVTEDEFIKVFDHENDYLKNWSRERKLQQINVIDYER